MATFVAMQEDGVGEAAVELARHLKSLTGQDPSGVDKVSDQQVMQQAGHGRGTGGGTEGVWLHFHAARGEGRRRSTTRAREGDDLSWSA